VNDAITVELDLHAHTGLWVSEILHIACSRTVADMVSSNTNTEINCGTGRFL
jgi:hypothetical protein